MLQTIDDDLAQLDVYECRAEVSTQISHPVNFLYFKKGNAMATCKNCGRDYEGSKGAGFWKWFCSNRCKDEFDERQRKKSERASDSRRGNRRDELNEQESEVVDTAKYAGVNKQNNSEIGCLRSLFNLAALIFLVWLAYEIISK